jgi:hypothetical protein
MSPATLIAGFSKHVTKIPWLVARGYPIIPVRAFIRGNALSLSAVHLL